MLLLETNEVWCCRLSAALAEQLHGSDMAVAAPFTLLARFVELLFAVAEVFVRCKNGVFVFGVGMMAFC